MPARLHPLPYAATQPADTADRFVTGEVAATRPDADGDDDPELYSGLVARIIKFAAAKRAHPDDAHDAIVIGKYFLLDLVDEGAMGIVCTALEPNFGTVALKFPKAAPGPQLRERVLLEGKLLARVHHTNVLRVYEIGGCEDTLYIATEYVDGTSLRAWQVDKPWQAIVRAYLDAARGLAAIHATGVVHQDIKPDNIRVDRSGVVRVLDFGLAHLESRMQDPPLTAPELGRGASPATFYRGGTPGYMAPEQYQPGLLADASADQFAFCAALWEALYGVLPYPTSMFATTVPGAERPVLGQPRCVTATGPRWLRKILLRGLADHKADRFPDMRALIAAIDRRLHRRWWPALTLAAATATAAALATARLSAPDLPMCEPDPTVWTTAQDESLATAAALAADPSAVPVIDSMRAELGAHARRWSAAHAAMCQRAHDAGSRAPADAREPCFAQRRRAITHVGAAITKFAATHQQSARAPWAEQRARWLQQLDPIDDCLATTPPYARANAPDPELDATLDAAITSSLAADDDAARRDFQRVLGLSTRDADPGDAWHRARARLGLVELAPSAADAHAELLTALRDAEISGDTLLAADVLALLIFSLADGADDPARALEHLPSALGKLTALGLATGRRARDIHLSAALAAVQSGRLTTADEHLTLVESLRDTPPEARELLIRAHLAERRGDLPTAILQTRAALATQRTLEGPGTRPVADTLRTLGTLQAANNDPDAATTLLQALQIYDDRASRSDALTIHLALTKLHYDADDLPRAREHAAPIAAALSATDLTIAEAPTTTDDLLREHTAPTANTDLHREHTAPTANTDLHREHTTPIATALSAPTDLPPTWRPMAELLLGHLALPTDPTAAEAHYTRALALLTARGVPSTIAGDRWLARLGLARAQLAQGHDAAARETLAPLLLAMTGEAAALREHILTTAAELNRRSASSL